MVTWGLVLGPQLFTACINDQDGDIGRKIDKCTKAAIMSRKVSCEKDMTLQRNENGFKSKRRSGFCEVTS